MATKGHVIFFVIISSIEKFYIFYILTTFCVSFTTKGRMVLEILYVELMYPQYSGVLKTCLALRYWFFVVLGSESVYEGQTYCRMLHLEYSEILLTCIQR